MSLTGTARAIVAATLGIPVLAVYVSGAIAPVVELPTRLTADALAICLKIAGFNALQTDGLVFTEGDFAYQIYYRCTGLLPAAALTLGIYAFPANASQRLKGLAIGIPLLIGFNLLRLVHLFSVGVNAPEYFWLAHDIVWEAAIVVFTILLWAGWLWYVGRHKQGELIWQWRVTTDRRIPPDRW